MVRKLALFLTALVAAAFLAGMAMAQSRPGWGGPVPAQYYPGGPGSPRWERYQGPPVYRTYPVPPGGYRVPPGNPPPQTMLPQAAPAPTGPAYGGQNYGLPPDQIRAQVLRTYPGRILSSQLLGPFYSFRILSLRGNIVDVVVDRATGRIVRSRGGP